MTIKRSHQLIVDLWDSGVSIEEIASRLCKSRTQIKIVVSTYDGTADFRRHRTNMQAGSAALLAAIQQVRA